MVLATFRRGRGAPKLGAVWREAMLDLGNIHRDLAAQRGEVTRRRRDGFPQAMLELVQGGDATLGLVRAAWEYGKQLVDQQGLDELARRKLAYPVRRVRLLAPLVPPRNVFCLGRNYAEHAAERGAAAPEHPVYFTKPAACVTGPGDPIVHHAITKELDYEVELTAVIGAGGRDIPRSEALRHVFGYTIINDVTARDLQKRHQQWFKGKGLDGFCPMGPVLVTADEIPDPQALDITLRVNHGTRQKSHTSKMIFPVDQCIEVLSQGFTLVPGDVIATGTPDGVGAATGNFLRAGDKIEAEVEKIGVLQNHVVGP